MRLLLLIPFLLQTAQCARILGIFHIPSYSHYIVGETLFKELAARGHELTVISAMPQKEPIKNFRDVPLVDLKDFMKAKDDEFITKILNRVPGPVLTIIAFQMFKGAAELALNDDNIKNFLKSNETFDLIILESFFNEAHLGFVHHFKAPVVLVHAAAPSLLTSPFMNDPTPFAYVPHLFGHYKPKMNYFQRVYNTFLSSFHHFFYRVLVLPQQNSILHTHFPDAPPVYDLMKNASLMLINSHPAMSAAVPLQPNVIQIGGFHVQKHKPLPEGLKKYLDEAKEGVVYFSMGSVMQSAQLPMEKRNALIKAFSKLKLKVLWKYEEDDLPGKPANVRIEKWLPQPAVLAHENVKVFVTHGGRLSAIEAIYFGKPTLGIPLFAEQHVNVQEAEYLGYGLHLDFNRLDDDEHLFSLLQEVIENPRYAEMAKYRSKILHSLPSTQLDTAMYWIESVIAHKGLPHLRNAGTDLEWYQLLLLDVLLFYVVAAWLLKKLLSILLSKLFRMCRRKEKLKKN